MNLKNDGHQGCSPVPPGSPFIVYMSSVSFTTSLKTDVSIGLALANRPFLSRHL